MASTFPGVYQCLKAPEKVAPHVRYDPAGHAANSKNTRSADREIDSFIFARRGVRCHALRAERAETPYGSAIHVSDLLQTMPSVQRAQLGTWSHFGEALNSALPTIASAAAFVAHSKSELAAVARTAKVDLLLGCHFPTPPNSCELWIHSSTPIGAQIAKFIKAIHTKTLKLTITIQ